MVDEPNGDTAPEKVHVSAKVIVGTYFDADVKVEGEGSSIASKVLYAGCTLVALVIGAAIYILT